MEKKEIVPVNEKNDSLLNSLEEHVFPRRMFLFNDYLFDSMQRYMEDMYKYHDNMFRSFWIDENLRDCCTPSINVDLNKYFMSLGNSSLFNKNLLGEYISPFKSYFRKLDDKNFYRCWKSIQEKESWFHQNKIDFPWKRNSYMNVSDNDKEMIVSLDVGQIPKEDVKVNISNGHLEVMGNVKRINEQKNTEEDMNCFMKQSYQSSFYKSFRLPENVEQQNIKAKLKDGKLNIIIPKKNRDSERSIKVD